MKKIDFNIPDGKLGKFLEVCEGFIYRNSCYGTSCSDCPLSSNFSSIEKFCPSSSVAVEQAKKFIKLFGGEMIYGIIVKDGNQSVKIQKLLFKGGLRWYAEGVHHTDERIIAVWEDCLDRSYVSSMYTWLSGLNGREYKLILGESFLINPSQIPSWKEPEHKQIKMTVAEIEKKLNIKNLHVVK